MVCFPDMQFAFPHTVAPLWVHLLSSRDPLSAGMAYQVVCQAAGARPSANITWRLGSTILTTHVDKVRPLSLTKKVLVQIA